MKINIKKLLYYILTPLILGAIIGYISNAFKGFLGIITPEFTPPKIFFPIIWSILYILMGLSRYLIYKKGNNKKAIKIYNLGLVINLMWPILFFLFKWYLLSFLWILILIGVVIYMIIIFYNISKTSSLIQIPYLLWIIFAAILNFAIYTLN